jgi:hypothetical protein
VGLDFANPLDPLEIKSQPFDEMIREKQPLDGN